MNKKLQHFASGVLGIAIMVFCGVGIWDRLQTPGVRLQEKAEGRLHVSETEARSLTPEASFLSGPLVADVGQLCVFTLDNPETRADWIIVPETPYYVDSSGSSLVFASNVSARYTIIAAVVEGGVPKILTHVCEYGTQPTPPPNPKPNPPPTTLTDWVAQNIPDTGKSTAAALAACYESVAQEIEKGSIRAQEAAFSALRTATQTKIDIGIWSGFLDALSEKITERLDGSADIHRLGTIFTEIADGLRQSRKTPSTDRRKP